MTLLSRLRRSRRACHPPCRRRWLPEQLLILHSDAPCLVIGVGPRVCTVRGDSTSVGHGRTENHQQGERRPASPATASPSLTRSNGAWTAPEPPATACLPRCVSTPTPSLGNLGRLVAQRSAAGLRAQRAGADEVSIDFLARHTVFIFSPTHFVTIVFPQPTHTSTLRRRCVMVSPPVAGVSHGNAITRGIAALGERESFERRFAPHESGAQPNEKQEEDEDATAPTE